MTASLMKIFDIGGSAMSAQTTRLNTISSNVANADSVSGSPEDTFKALKTLFTARYTEEQSLRGVQVKDIVSIDKDPIKEYLPDHPMADIDGFIYKPSVNVIEELTDSMNASRGFDVNANVIDTAKKMIERVLRLGE